MSLVTPIAGFPSRNATGTSIATASVRVSVANDGIRSAQVVICRKGEGGDYSIAKVLNIEGGVPATEAIVTGQPGTEYIVGVLNGQLADLRAYISAVSSTEGDSLASIDAKLPAALGPQTSAGSLSITFASNIPTLPVSIPGNAFDRNTTGSITGTSAVSLDTQGCGVVALQLSGTWTGTVDFQASVDGSAWVAFPMDPTGAGDSVTSATANGTWTGAIAGYKKFQAIGAAVSGTATAYINASTASTTVTVESSALPSGAATSSAQTAGNASLSSIDGKTPSLGQALMAASVPVAIASNQSAVPISGTVAVSNAFALDATLTGGTQKSRITDGTNDVAIKAASTAAAATDPALVVAQSPNAPSLTPAITSKASSATSVTVLASNSARKGAGFYNLDANDLYLNEAGGTATTSIGGFTVIIPYRGYYELQPGANGGVTTGTITGIWAAAGSAGASITERS